MVKDDDDDGDDDMTGDKLTMMMETQFVILNVYRLTMSRC